MTALGADCMLVSEGDSQVARLLALNRNAGPNRSRATEACASSRDRSYPIETRPRRPS